MKKPVSKYTPHINAVMGGKKVKKAKKSVSKRKPAYKIPKTPKVSGMGWGM